MQCPYPVKMKKDQIRPCGQCTHCRINRRGAWTLRNILELQDHTSACFLTLTYSDKNLPDPVFNPDIPPRGLLSVDDVQKFFKRLRKYYHPVKLRYFGCGEYSPEKQRPHYHFIVYGMPEVMPGSPQHQKITDIWDKGHVHCGSVTRYSIQYVSGYFLKSGRPRDWCYVVPERTFMSLGIGKSAIDRLIAKIDKHGYAEHFAHLHHLRVDGKKLPVDRYIRDRVNRLSYTVSTGANNEWTPHPDDLAILEALARDELHARTVENQRAIRKGGKNQWHERNTARF
ncbi:MAG: hypothetical protein QXT77_07605 [Candidatus Methanomethylicaceae archaeon]